MLEFEPSAEEFRSRFLERQVYFGKGALTQRPMEWRHLDDLLARVEPDELSVQLFNRGQIAPQNYLDETFEVGQRRRRINKHRFYALMEQHATLVLNRVEAYSLEAKRLCAEVGRFVGCTTTGNAYVSFGGDGTFGKHWDTHDVFAIQLIGKKRWQVYAPTLPYPLSHQTSSQIRHECPSTPILDVVLAAGDLLYIPRGWWHEVTPVDEGSLHLSVGAYLPTVSDYVMWACSRQLPRIVAARRGLIDQAGSVAELEEVMQALAQIVVSADCRQEFLRDLHARERLNGEFNTALFLDRHAGVLHDDTRLTLTCSYRPDNHGEVFINGGRMRLEPVSRAIVHLLSQATVLKLADLQAHLPHIPHELVHGAIKELARHEVVTVTAAA